MFKAKITEEKFVTMSDVLSALRHSKKEYHDEYPVLSEKGKRIQDKISMIPGVSQIWVDILSELLGEKLSPVVSNGFAKFKVFTPIVVLKSRNGHTYPIGEMIFYSGTGSNFYRKNGIIGNTMDSFFDCWRFPTEEEVEKLFGYEVTN